MNTHEQLMSQPQAWTPLETEEQKEAKEQDVQQRWDSGVLMDEKEMQGVAVRFGMKKPNN